MRAATYGRPVNYVGGVSKARAKKKRRQRARAAGEAAGAAAAKAPRAGTDGGAKAPRGAGAAAKAPRAAGGRRGDAADAKAPRAAAPAARETEGRSGALARPQPVWAPFPLTEIGMLAGLVIFVAGFASNSIRTLSIGALVLAVVTGELCLREHFAGFRSHTLLLAALPVIVVHSFVVLAITDAYRGPLTLAADLAIGGALAWYLRARFRAAQERARAAVAG